MDLLRSREKDPLSAKYSTFPGWHSSHIYQLNSSTAADLQYPTNYNSSTAESDYTGKVRKLRSNNGRYKEGDIHEQLEEWERTWPINCRGREEKKQQDYASFYHHSLSNKTSGFAVEEWRSGIEKVLGCGETKEQSQPTSHNRHQADLREREQWRDWSTSLNMGSIFPIVWFREPPSYTAPPAYSHPKDWDKKAGIRNAPKQEHTESFKEQTMECRKENFTDSTETRRNPNNGHYLQKHNQNTERYCLQASNTVLQYTAINNKPSSHALLQHRDSSEITYPDVSRTRQNKLSWRKGGETVFCLVSRMGEVSGLASSPEEPLKPHVLPLITDPKPDGRTNTPWSNDNSRQNQEEYPRDEAVRQLHGSLMSEEFGRASLEHTGGDQRSSSITDFSNAIKPKENKQELQCYAQRNDSPSHCLTQKSYRDEKPFKEILEKFPLWKEPKYQRQRNEQSQGINSVVTNTKDSSRSTQDRQKSLVVIDATRVVVKVELVLLPEKEHVQYVSLTEDSLWSRTRDELKQNSSVVASQETQTYSTVGEERILGRPHEYPRTGLQTYSQEHIRSSGTNLVDPITGVEDSPSAAETVEQGLVGQPWSGTTLDNNEGRMKEEPEAALEGFQTNAKSTPEDSEQTEKTTVQTKEATNQEQEPTLDDRVVKHRIKKDNENHQKDTLPEDSSAEENLSDEKEDMEELVLDGKKDREELVSDGKDDREELVSDRKDDREELVSDGKDDREELVSDGKDDREELVSDGKDDREELVSDGKDDREELVSDGKDDREELVSDGKDDKEELVSDGKDDREELVSDGKDDREEMVSDGKDDREELVLVRKDDREELVLVGKDDREELVLVGKDDREELVSDGKDDREELVSVGKDDREELVSDGKDDREELVSDGKDDREELVSDGKDDREELVSDGKDDREELVSDGKDDREELVSDGKDDREELVSVGKDDREELVSVGKDDMEELVLDCSIPLPKSRAREIQHKVVLSPIEGFSTLRRSSSSPHLLFSSSSRTWDGSHTENEASSTNTNGPQSSSLPFLYSSASEDPCRSIAEVLLCTPSLPELKAEEPHAISLWDAVSRIRRHTAPDSETEEEEDLLHHRLSKEHE